MTAAASAPSRADDLQFFRVCITAMAVVLVSGFVFQLAMGRSSFGAPLVVHLHAFTFMGWVGIVVTQAWLATGGAMAQHRLLGRVAMVWAFALAVMGALVTAAAVQTLRTPFFFQPQHFLIVNPIGLLGSLGLLAAAVALRHRPDWHPRLQIGAFALLMGPGFGRLLPMPLLTPYAFEIATIAGLIAPAVGALRDWRVHGRAHPAWLWPFVVLAATLIVARLIAFSPIGDALYQAVTAGTPAAGFDGRAFPPPPGI